MGISERLLRAYLRARESMNRPEKPVEVRSWAYENKRVRVWVVVERKEKS